LRHFQGDLEYAAGVRGGHEVTQEFSRWLKDGLNMCEVTAEYPKGVCGGFRVPEVARVLLRLKNFSLTFFSVNFSYNIGNT
jgi:hypothetical protein